MLCTALQSPEKCSGTTLLKTGGGTSQLQNRNLFKLLFHRHHMFPPAKSLFTKLTTDSAAFSKSFPFCKPGILYRKEILPVARGPLSSPRGKVLESNPESHCALCFPPVASPSCLVSSSSPPNAQPGAPFAEEVLARSSGRRMSRRGESGGS